MAINLVSAENTSLLEGKNDSHGGTVGVGIGVGSGGWGSSVSASANKGKGSESGNGTTHSETTVDAGNRLTLNSGRDTTLTGAQVSGDTVIADIGRNLTLTSEQDSDRYDSKQQNTSAGGSFTFGSMSGSASVNLSKDKMHSNYDSVVEQTGIFAGKGGYDITVGEHTQLNGAVIGSTATADNNRLDTGTLGWGDIDNRADFKTEHQSVGFCSGGSIGSQFAGNMANGLLTGGNNEGHDSSTTHAAISEGDIIVRDKDRQQQDVANLSRDVEHDNQTLSPIFDKEKEQQRLQQTQLIGEIGNQVADIARTEGQINTINAGKAELAARGVNEPEKGASKEAWERYNAQLAATDGYKAAQQQWGTGSSVQQAIQAATAAVQGLAGSDLKAALAGGAAPYVAEVIKQYSPNETSRVMAHAIMAGVAAELQGNSAAAGAAGAATAAIGTSVIAKALYGTDDFSKLSETQKQTVSALSTLASGLAGGLAGGDTSGAVAGGQAGKNTSENNDMFSLPSGLNDYGAAAASWNQYAVDKNLTPEQTQAGLDKLAKGDLPEGANITKVIVDGYKDGVLIAGAAYLGPAASIGKVVGGAAIAEIANGTYQWFDINSEKNQSLPENQQKTWDYKGSISAGITGALAPGRGIWQNAGIAAGGTLFTDGPDSGALTGTGAGWAFGTAVSSIAPSVLEPALGPGSGFVSDIIGSVGGEFIGNKIKDKINEKDANHDEK
ncbi:hemagglutinin repeat-containing protein [Raoultella planticola]|nr:hemagglutinin repeat-containing protein [Raoultella planticola]MDC3911519.1 hemagglutinin repeat-containing protein [Raoultella planticola]